MISAVALIGSSVPLCDATYARFETPQQALHAGARLLIFDERAWAESLRSLPASAHCAVVASAASRGTVGGYMKDSRVRHVFDGGKSLLTELAQTKALLDGVCHYRAESIGFGAPQQSFTVWSSSEEGDALSRAENFAHRCGARGRAAQNWLDALAETVSNAVYNAPRDGAHPTHQALHRSHRVDLATHDGVNVTLHTAANQIAFAVTDAFGSLRPEHFQLHLGRALSDQPAAPMHKAGGAGLGLVMMYDRVDRLIAMVDEGLATTLVGVGPLSYSRETSRGHTVQFFEHAKLDTRSRSGGKRKVESS